ncbi:MAG TPA: VOC family protein [Acidimicrobiales bacterium]|jgi:predicted enzyme related to lactoylglutathione lyase|nr:VOC family protein [Acidimicrobiales bacterium]
MGGNPTLEVVLDCSEPETLMGFWRDALGYRVLYSEPSLAVLVPADRHACPVLLQQVPEPKAGKNRMHVDIVTDDVEVEVTRLEGLGARRLHDDTRTFGPTRWVTMADPENNEFCVSSGVKW